MLAHLSGEPIRIEENTRRPDPLTVVAEPFHYYSEGIIQVFAKPVKQNLLTPVKQWMKERKYRAKEAESKLTVAAPHKSFFSGRTEESATYMDMSKRDEAGSLYREIRRIKAEHVCAVSFSVGCWGDSQLNNERNAKLIANVMSGALVPADLAKEFTLKVSKKKKEFEKLAQGFPVGPESTLLPEEAVSYFILPQCDLGISVSRRQAFSTSTKPMPESVSQGATPIPHQKPRNTSGFKLSRFNWLADRKDVIVLGNPIRANGDAIADRFEWFDPKCLDSHLMILGNTRAGKTETARTVTAQAIRCGINVTIMVPRRPRDWNRLMFLDKEIRVFKAGKEGIPGLHINFFEPPLAPFSKWLKVLVEKFSGWLPNDRVMELHFDDIFHTMYRNCGWDIKQSVRGRPILLSDFWDAVEEVCLDFRYGEEVKRNFYGALYGRVSSMLRNSALVGMYNTTEGITWKELVEGNNIIDMEDIHTDDQKFLVGIISAGIHMYKMGNPSSRLTNLLVIEEASYLLKKPKQADIYGSDVSMIAIEGVMDMLTTAGGNGLGIILIEQLAGRLYENAVKIIVNTISHAIGHQSERTLVAGHLGIKEDKADHLLGMRKGEVIVRFEGMSSPTNVQIVPLDRHLDQSLPDFVAEEMISKVMEPEFKAHPEWGKSVDLPEDIIARLQRAKPEEALEPTPVPVLTTICDIEKSREFDFEDALNQMDDVIGLSQYKNNYMIRAEEADSGNLVTLVSMMVKVGGRLCPKSAEPGPFREKLFTVSQKRYNVPSNSVAIEIIKTLRGEVSV